MKKTLIILFVVLLACSLALVATACDNTPADGGDDVELKEFTGITFPNASYDFDGTEKEVLCLGVPEGASVQYSGNKATEDGTHNATATISMDGYKDLTLTSKLTIVMTPEYVVASRQRAEDNAVQNYDFTINLAAGAAISGFDLTGNAHYEGQYRYNRDTDVLSFKRVTSGALLYDAVEWIYNNEGNKIKLKANEDGVVKRISVVPAVEEELNLINIPFAAIVDNMQAVNLTNIVKGNFDGFSYKAKLALASDNALLGKVFGILSKLGSTIKIGEVSLSNPAAGIDFYFNLTGNKTLLSDYKFRVAIAFPVKGVNASFALDYQQKAASSTISIPSTAGFYTSASEIASQMSIVNDAITALKNSSSYSLDLEARNEFDPAWNQRAIVDKYIARMYKNTNDDRVDFNHSFEYKAHTEAEGAETFKYTIGNIQDGTVHQVSRKGSNAITALSGVSADTQFDLLAGMALIDANDVDCIKKSSKSGETIYEIYMKKDKALSVQDSIIDLINSNEAEGVLDIDNYFNSSDYDLADAYVEVAMKSGSITSINVGTKLKYEPTISDYMGQIITLTDTIELVVNDKLSDAQDYVAPKGTETKIGSFGLNNQKFYIA